MKILMGLSVCCVICILLLFGLEIRDELDEMKWHKNSGL